jgi:hypothetical protein
MKLWITQRLWNLRFKLIRFLAGDAAIVIGLAFHEPTTLRLKFKRQRLFFANSDVDGNKGGRVTMTTAESRI